MIEIGKTYKTKGGIEVQIIDYIQWPTFSCFRGSNKMDYNEKGEASFAMMHRGYFRSPINDLIIK